MYGFAQGGCFQQSQQAQWSTPPQRFQATAAPNPGGYGFSNAGQNAVAMGYIGSGSCQSAVGSSLTATVGGSSDGPMLAHRAGFSASVMPGHAPVHGPFPAKGSSQRASSPLMPTMGAKGLEGAKSPNKPGFGQNCPTSCDWHVHCSSGNQIGGVASARSPVRELSPPPIPGNQRPAALRPRQNSLNMPRLPPTSVTPSVPLAARGSLQGQQPLLVAQQSPKATNALQTPQSPQAAAVSAAAAAAVTATTAATAAAAALAVAAAATAEATPGLNGGGVRRFSSAGSDSGVLRFSSGLDCVATSRSRLTTSPSQTLLQQQTDVAGSQKTVGGYAVPNRRRVRSHGASARVSFDDTVVTKQTTEESDSIRTTLLDKADWEARKDAEIAQAVDVERRRASQIEAEKNAEIEALRQQLASAEMRAQQQSAHAEQEPASTNNFPAKRSTKSFIRLHLGKFVGGAGVANEVSLSDDGTRCKLETSQERKKISAELFKALDTTGVSQLGPLQLLPLAELIGFEGTDEEWVKEYDILSQRYGWDPQIGAGKEQFMRMIDDEGSSAHLTDFELRLLLAELESHHEVQSPAHGPRSRSSTMQSSCARRKSVYENGHPHRRKSMVARVDCDSGYSNEY